jgi:hypothetical protein
MAADDADRTTTVTRLVELLRSRGWPLQPEHDVQVRSLPLRGDRAPGMIATITYVLTC